MKGRTRVWTHTRGTVTITFLENAYDPDLTDTTFETTFVFLIRRGGDLTIETDRHRMGLFPYETWTASLRDVGFNVHVVESKDPDPEGHRPPWFVCVKPP